MLSSLEIKNFRTFSHLVIERLGRVNLIVGKNNVGKTTLLEALRLYGSSWAPGTIPAILIDRDETIGGPNNSTWVVFKSLFHNWKMVKGDEITLGPVDDSGAVRKITMGMTEPMHVMGSEGQRADATTTTTPPPALSGGKVFLEIRDGESEKVSTALEEDALKSAASLNTLPWITEPAYLPPGGLPGSGMARWWDAIALTDAEDRVIHATHCIAPIKRISFIADPSDAAKRTAKILDGENKDRRAMRSMGDGVIRVFQIALTHEYAAIRAKQEQVEDRDDRFPKSLDASFLLLDEVENGIHHSVLPKLWKFVFRLARQLNVQVFATTHSQDCLRGFAEAVAEDEAADGQVIRLEKANDKSRAILFDQEELRIVARERIEVR